MWLLNTTSLALEYVVDCKRYGYAILSHTWDGDEVTFQEMQAGLGREKRGFWKILKTCQEAAKLPLRYAWVDTCCINKDSSAELSEAINSMWQWYCNAAVCYVYLSDVGPDCPLLTDAGGKDWSDDERTESLVEFDEISLSWRDIFSRSRWFTRGWKIISPWHQRDYAKTEKALQELLAPEFTKFYGSGWNLIGFKADLIKTIGKITGIDQLALASRQWLPAFVIARKMSWAAGRQTSRIEDRAYSLLGIFGVNMFLLYGEGEKAFTRLQEELVRKTTDHSVLAWESKEEHEWSGRTDVDLLFAKSPDEFEIGRTIVRWNPKKRDSQYSLTNNGIEFQNLFFIETDKGCFGMLNCRFEDDLRGPLALRLCEPAATSKANAKWRVGDPNEFWIDCKDLEGYKRGLRWSRRLVVYSDFEAPNRHGRRITLLRYHPAMRWDPKLEMYARQPKILLKKGESSIDGFVIVFASPKSLWNKETGVMCPPFNSGRPGQHKSSVTVMFERSEAVLSIAFCIPGFSLEPTRDLDPGSTGLKVALHESASQERAMQILDVKRHSMKTEVLNTYDKRFSASVKLTNIMEDAVYIVEVSMEPMATN